MIGKFNPSVNFIDMKLPNFSPYFNMIITVVIRTINAMPRLTDIPGRETPPFSTIPLTMPKVNITQPGQARTKKGYEYLKQS